MIYQLTCNLFFDDMDPIEDIRDKILDHFEDACVINPGARNQETSWFHIDKCFHDHQPNQPCIPVDGRDNG